MTIYPRVFLFTIAIMASASRVHVQVAERPELGWVGLYGGAVIEWLENENRLDSLSETARGRGAV